MKLTKRVMIIPVASLLLLLGGCGSRVSQFKDFGEAGVKYADTMNKLLDASGGLAIDATSAYLISNRSSLIDDVRTPEKIKKIDELLVDRLRILNAIADHNQLLKLYFKALADLAGSNAGTEIAAGTKGIVDELSKLNPKISEATLGEAPIGSLIGPVTNLAVASFQQAALEKELKDHAKTIQGELELQIAAMQAVATIWKSDQESIIDENKKINQEQFLNKDNVLPENWAANRKTALTASTSVELADSVTKAPERLKNAFEALVKGDKANLKDIPLIVNDLNKVLELIELVKKGPSA